ncbi:MAG: DUF2007 domain-containing protein [Daejeonella sp.]
MLFSFLKKSDNTEPENKIRPVEVFAGELWQATMIKNILEDNGIQVFLENNLMSTIDPWIVEAGGFNPAKIIISNLDYDLSVQLINEFNNNEPPNDLEENHP